MSVIERWSPEDQAEALRLLRALAAPDGPDEAVRERVWTWLKDRPLDPPPGAVSLAEVCEFLRAATYPDPACGGTRHVSGWQSAAVALEREFGGR
jgi:hypothetical protein